MDEPPSNKTDMGYGAGILSTDDTLAGRFKGIRKLWASDWDICPVRTVIHTRRLFIFDSLQGKRNRWDLRH